MCQPNGEKPKLNPQWLLFYHQCNANSSSFWNSGCRLVSYKKETQTKNTTLSNPEHTYGLHCSTRITGTEKGRGMRWNFLRKQMVAVQQVQYSQGQVMSQSKNMQAPWSYHGLERDGIFLIGRGQSCKVSIFYSLHASDSHLQMLFLNYACRILNKITMFGQALTTCEGLAYFWNNDHSRTS